MKESLRRLSVVIVWLVTIICCFLVFLAQAEWWFYFVWCCFGIVGHNIVNWIFQKDSGGDKIDWESIGEVTLGILCIHWGFILLLGVTIFLLTGVRAETFAPFLIEYDLARISGHLAGRFVGACFVGYVFAVILKTLFIFFTSSFVKKLLGF